MFFAFNKYEQHYEMMDEPEFDGKYDDETGYDEEQEKHSDEYGKTHPDDESTVPVYDVDNETAHNANYWHVRLSPFVEWIEEMVGLRQTVAFARAIADQKIPDYETLKANINADGQIFEHNYPISLNKKITSGVSDDWYLNKSSSVSVRYTILPCLYAVVQWRECRRLLYRDGQGDTPQRCYVGPLPEVWRTLQHGTLPHLRLLV